MADVAIASVRPAGLPDRLLTSSHSSLQAAFSKGDLASCKQLLSRLKVRRWAGKGGPWH